MYDRYLRVMNDKSQNDQDLIRHIKLSTNTVAKLGLNIKRSRFIKSSKIQGTKMEKTLEDSRKVPKINMKNT